MPFLDWFKRKSESKQGEAKLVLAEKPATGQAEAPKTVVTNLPEDATPDAQPFSLSRPQQSEAPSAEDDPGGKEPQEPLAPLAAAAVNDVAAGRSGDAEKEIRLPLRPIFSNFPPELETPAMQSVIGTEAEIALPLSLIQAQLPHGRVVIPAEIFRGALPSNLKHYFEAIDSAAEIPIPLEEVFSRLPPEAIKLREDQELDRPEETIPTPFSAHAEEDANRFGEVVIGAGSPVMETPPPKHSNFGVECHSEGLQALFLTDEPLDLAKTIKKIAELPGLKSCILHTTDGFKLAGSFGNPDQEKAVSTLLPVFFERTRLQFEVLHAGMLETITLYFGAQQLSIFVQAELCLTVLHDRRPFKPGVREKVQSVISELAALAAIEKPL